MKLAYAIRQMLECACALEGEVTKMDAYSSDNIHVDIDIYGKPYTLSLYRNEMRGKCQNGKNPLEETC